jgi:hypothetical protein
LLLVVVSAGCIGANETGVTANGSTSITPPDTPQQLNNSSVESYALEYEQRVLEQRLADRYDEEQYGVGCCTTTKDAGVVVEKSGSYYVQVLYPYYYSTSGGETDAASRALYVVSEDTSNRIELSHHTVTAEDPYSGPNQSTNEPPPKIWVVNMAGETRTFSMSLRHVRQNELAYNHSMELSADESMEFSGIVLRRGEYRLLFGDGEKELTSSIMAKESAPDNVYILITENGTNIHRTADL